MGGENKIASLVKSLNLCLFNMPVVFIIMEMLFRLSYEETQ